MTNDHDEKSDAAGSESDNDHRDDEDAQDPVVVGPYHPDLIIHDEGSGANTLVTSPARLSTMDALICEGDDGLNLAHAVEAEARAAVKALEEGEGPVVKAFLQHLAEGRIEEVLKGSFWLSFKEHSVGPIVGGALRPGHGTLPTASGNYVWMLLDYIDTATNGGVGVADAEGEEGETTDYEVEVILDHDKARDGDDLVKVHWAGYGSERDTWESEVRLNINIRAHERMLTAKPEYLQRSTSGPLQTMPSTSTSTSCLKVPQGQDRCGEEEAPARASQRRRRR